MGKGKTKDTDKEQGAQKEPINIVRLIRRLRARISMNRKRFILYSILRLLVLITLVRCAILGEYENVGLCILALVLFLIPAFFEESFHIEIPVMFESIIYLFIYASWILGEIQNYYVQIPGWDTMLHTMNGFLCVAVGFSLVDLLNRRTGKVKMSPISVTIVAFCFSMTVGVCWEFIEYFFDSLFLLDMQKDAIVQSIGSVKLNPDGTTIPVKIYNITKTVIYTASGQTYTVNGGYLDIGINDTMKDLFVNLIGALAFSIIGYNYIANRSESNIAPAFEIRYESPEETAAIHEQLDKTGNMTYMQQVSSQAQEILKRRKEDKDTDDESRPEKTEPVRTPSGSAPTFVKLGQNIVITAWVAILFAAASLILFYPVGHAIINMIFIAVTFLIIASLIAFLFVPGPVRRSKNLWAVTFFCMADFLMFSYRFVAMSTYSLPEIRVTAIALAACFFFPIALWRMYRGQLRAEGVPYPKRGRRREEREQKEEKEEP